MLLDRLLGVSNNIKLLLFSKLYKATIGNISHICVGRFDAKELNSRPHLLVVVNGVHPFNVGHHWYMWATY
jgi:hypothetical protein